MLKTKMAKNLFLIFIVTCSLIATPLIGAQQKEEPKFKLVQFHMAIVKKGPKWTDAKTPEVTQIHQQHFGYVISLLDSGKAIIAGPLGDDAGILGIFIFRAKSAEEAKAWADEDPAARAGFHVNEMHPWWSQDIFKKASSPLKLNAVYLAFLKRGPNRKEGDGETPEVQELQKAHIANIERLAKLGKIVVAGPFGDDGNLRGIFVFRVASLQEAQELCATDPMIKIGRLAVELHPWLVSEGVLP
jgi:uncharacterized protein YciI